MTMTTTTERREQLDKAVAALTTTEGWARWLKFRATQHTYSFANQILALMQRPSVEIMRPYGNKAGTTGWRAVGCQVRKGEKAIKIFAPIIVKREVDGKTENVLIGFKTVNVFSQDQVDGDIPKPCVEVLAGEAPKGFREALEAVAASEGLAVSVEPIAGAVCGYLDMLDRRIVIADRLDPAAAVKTLAHELAHWFDPELASRDAAALRLYAEHRADAEILAESVAYVVCAARGMDSDPYSVGYVATWANGDLDEIKALASRVDGVARKLLEKLGTDSTEEEVD
jgi:antirestriction protein ArdC